MEIYILDYGRYGKIDNRKDMVAAAMQNQVVNGD